MRRILLPATLAAALLPVALAAALPAAAQEIRPAAGLGPQLSGEMELNLYGVRTYRAPEARRRYTDIYAKGELELGLHLTPGLSVQSTVKFEPVAEGGENGGSRAFQDQAAFVESLFLLWEPTDRLKLQAGKFTAPFAFGYGAFPGIRLADRAEEIEEIAESMGFGASYTWLSDLTWGEHDISAAVFALDTSFLSSTFITRKRWGRDEAEHYARNTRFQGGPGNTGRLNNWAVALDGDQIGWLPNFAYHASVLSRGAGEDGTAREWGLALGAQYEIGWTDRLKTTLFAEWLQFRSAGGRPVEALEDGTEAAVAERRRNWTLAARTSHGPWRATIGWQRDERQRAANGVPGENYLEVSAGRELG
jgi:hypothetical protein